MGPTEKAVGRFNHTFIRRAQAKSGEYALGGSLDRPLACAPGLVCTGPDFDVLPSTCVKERPADLCFYGPWWDSSRCPRAPHVNVPLAAMRRGGMSREWAIEALRSALLLYPAEVTGSFECKFWSDPHVEFARKQLYDIVQALWPTNVVGAYPTMQEVKTSILKVGDVELVGLDPKKCSDAQADPDSPITVALSTSWSWASRPNLVWSLIHFVMHNQPAPMSQKAVAASRAMATHLSENFWCNDCRGFFTIGVLSAYGLPPKVADGEAHARYWNFGHNVASEHVATTRGGHPWIVSFAEGQQNGVGNPYYMPYETSVRMWRVDLSEPDLRIYDVRNVNVSHND